ncbi:hypothetical protein IGJ35_002585 [Enterococcus sp. AZ107]
MAVKINDLTLPKEKTRNRVSGRPSLTVAKRW